MSPSHLSPVVSEEAPCTDVRESSPWPRGAPPVRGVPDALEPDVFAAWGLGPEAFSAYAAPARRPPPHEPPSIREAQAGCPRASSPGAAAWKDDGAWEGAQSLLAGGVAPPRVRRPGD